MKKLGYGLMRLPRLEGSEELDVERVKGLVDVFMQRGFTYFDTAYVYTGSENAFKEAVVKRYPRDAYTVTNKIPVMLIKKEEELAEYFEKMLERTGVDYFDYVWLHAIGDSRYPMLKEIHAFEFLKSLKDSGKARHIGFSFHGTPECLDTILTEQPCVEYVQLQINYLDWEDYEVQSRRCYEVATAHHKPVIVMEPVKGGTLANVIEPVEKMFKEKDPNASMASWAIRFVASLDNVMVVLSGMSDEAQVEDNTSYMEDFQPLNEEELQMVLKAGDIIRNTITVPCTACHYCTDTCPMNIAIPDYFAIYNRVKKLNNFENRAKREFNKIAEDHGKPSDCIQCGTCESMCPQHIHIRQFLEDIADELESKL